MTLTFKWIHYNYRYKMMQKIAINKKHFKENEGKANGKWNDRKLDSKQVVSISNKF